MRYDNIFTTISNEQTGYIILWGLIINSEGCFTFI